MLRSIELPEAMAQRLMEMGLVPGSTVSAPFAAPGGDPRVYRVDGAEVALRREMARFLLLETGEPGGPVGPLGDPSGIPA